ncbi:3-oxoadipate enol-lactonase [Trinickia dabaoshanensis]|uniref:3-oxoadipate enol-lactonase n=1 Tax=Trinickia dabaoshanensis TaxID=564714 RepID=A0A2N7VJ92_9BURK|nr:3-oxoadipate enol-lactonase [Trinickia dabaoshanensis]PMS17220.1 3-oxoadipate enol-lactonase [Trinickia dabaoshanensis]
MEALSHFTAGDGARIAYRFDGRKDAPVLVLSNSIATSLAMWDSVMPDLVEHFRVLRYDTRGHGASDAPAGAYSIDRLGRDVVELLDALELERVHFLGLSLGGMIGQWLGIRAPERIERLVLSNTSAYLGPAHYFDERIAQLAHIDDMRETAEGFIRNWFSQATIDARVPAVDAFRRMVLDTPPQGLAGAFAAVRDLDFRRTVALIDRPSLVIAGKDDTVTLPAHGEAIAAAIAGARYLSLPCVHLPNVESRQAFVDAVAAFLLERRVN